MGCTSTNENNNDLNKELKETKAELWNVTNERDSVIKRLEFCSEWIDILESTEVTN